MEVNLQIYAKSAEKTSSRACFSQGNRIKMQQVGNQCYFVPSYEYFLVRHPLQIKQLIVAGYFGAVALMFFLCRRIHARCFQEGIFLQWRSGMSFWHMGRNASFVLAECRMGEASAFSNLAGRPGSGLPCVLVQSGRAAPPGGGAAGFCGAHARRGA